MKPFISFRIFPFIFLFSTLLMMKALELNARPLQILHAEISEGIASGVPFEKGLQGKSLNDTYLASIKRSESLDIQEELLQQAREGTDQALGAILPTINGTLTALKQEEARNATGNLLYPSTQNLGRITGTQPLFRGLRDFAALRQRKSLVDSQIQNFLTSARQLFYDVATAYYTVLTLQQDIQNYRIVIQINQRRLQELQSFFKIGRAQQTDVLTFRANIDSLEAQLEATRGQYEQAKDTLAYLSGWERNMPLQDQERLPVHLELEPYLAKLEERPEVQFAVSNVKAYEENVPIAWGGHLPTADLIGNYYLFRPGALSSVSWDVQLALNFPIFQGFIVQSQVRQAHSISRQYHLLLSQARRLAEREIRLFYDALEADQKQVKKLSELVQTSKKNYETESRYFRDGLVTNLDVLQAMTVYQDSLRQLNHAQYQSLLDYVRLQAAAGQRPETHLGVPQ